jgi:diacylglycerol kinase (ATP)
MHGQKIPPLKTRFIVNLHSGRAARCAEALRAFAARHGATVLATERPRHASTLATEALGDGCELVVAVGGDGTMNEVASALVGTGAILGLVPCGSGDGLGRHLRIHGPAQRAMDLLLEGRPRVIDSGLADGHPFFTVAGVGFEAEIAQRFNQLQRRGFLRYLSTSVRSYFQFEPPEYTVVQGGERHRFNAFTLAVANANQYGNNAWIAPAAQADDGLLDLCAIPPVSLLNGAQLAARLFGGSIGRARGVRQWQANRFVVERSGPGVLHTDGEVHPAGATIEFTIRPASLRVMCPAEK